jgi:hypothetical protein
MNHALPLLFCLLWPKEPSEPVIPFVEEHCDSITILEKSDGYTVLLFWKRGNLLTRRHIDRGMNWDTKGEFFRLTWEDCGSLGHPQPILRQVLVRSVQYVQADEMTAEMEWWDQRRIMTDLKVP